MLGFAGPCERALHAQAAMVRKAASERPSSSNGTAAPSSGKAGKGKKRKAESSPQVLMYVVLVAVVSLLALAGLVHYSRGPVVVALTASSFDRFLADHPAGVLVDFYKKGCPWCVKLEPEFEKAAKQLSSDGIALASLDGEAETAIARKLDLSRYPTVLWFRNGVPVQELPPMSRTAEKILEFVEWVRQPAMVTFETMAEFEDGMTTLRGALSGTTRPAVAVFGGDTSEAMLSVSVVAEKLRGKVVFMQVREARPAAEGPPVRAFGGSEEADKDYDGPLTAAALEEWASKMLS